MDQLAAFFDVIHQDPVISQLKLIAKPWDLIDMFDDAREQRTFTGAPAFPLHDRSLALFVGRQARGHV